MSWGLITVQSESSCLSKKGERMEPEKIYDRQYLMSLIVYFSFSSAIGFYLLLVELVLRSAGPAVEPPVLLKTLFYALAVLCAVGVWVAPRTFVKKVLPGDLSKLGQAMLTFQIFISALAEAPAVLGLVLAFSSRQKAEFYRLAVWSLVLMILAFPKKGFWQQVASCARTLK